MKAIVGYEGIYSVTENGKIISHARVSRRGHNIKEKEVIPYVSEKGYLKIKIYKNGVIRNTSIHRLVAETYVPNPNGLPFVNHLDGDKEHNHWSNLEWCTQLDNVRHAIATGLTLVISGSKHKACKFTPEQVAYIRTSDKTQVELAKEFKVKGSCLWKCKHYKTYKDLP